MAGFQLMGGIPSSRVTGCRTMCPGTSRRQANGMSRTRRHYATKLALTAAVRSPSSLPNNVQSKRPVNPCRNCSTARRSQLGRCRRPHVAIVPKAQHEIADATQEK